MVKISCSAAILCGGQSRRMGFDKSVGLRNKSGQSLLAALAKQLAERFTDVFLITNNSAKISAHDELKTFQSIEDIYQAVGPAGAIYTALKSIPGHQLFIMACDMPVVDWPLIYRLNNIMCASQADAVVPRHGGVCEPLYAFYGRGAEQIFKNGLDQGLRKAHGFLPLMKSIYIDVTEQDLASGFNSNLNTVDDLIKAGLAKPENAV